MKTRNVSRKRNFPVFLIYLIILTALLAGLFFQIMNKNIWEFNPTLLYFMGLWIIFGLALLVTRLIAPKINLRKIIDPVICGLLVVLAFIPVYGLFSDNFKIVFMVLTVIFFGIGAGICLFIQYYNALPKYYGFRFSPPRGIKPFSNRRFFLGRRTKTGNKNTDWQRFCGSVKEFWQIYCDGREWIVTSLAIGIVLTVITGLKSPNALVPLAFSIFCLIYVKIKHGAVDNVKNLFLCMYQAHYGKCVIFCITTIVWVGMTFLMKHGGQ